MSSIGLNEHHKRMFPSEMILLEIDPSEVFSLKERQLVLKYKHLIKRLEENSEQGLRLQNSNGIFVRIKIYQNNKKYRSIRKRMKQIEESKELSALLFRKRYILVAEQHKIERKLAEEGEKRYISAILESISKGETKQAAEAYTEPKGELAELIKLETELKNIVKGMRYQVMGNLCDDVYCCTESELKAIKQRIEENDIIPQKYKSQFVVSFLIQAIKSRRADTVAEALELYERRNNVQYN